MFQFLWGPKKEQKTILLKEYDKNNKLIYNGNTKGGKRNGLGDEYYPNGKVKYRGQWKNGKKDGKGVLFFDNGTVKFVGYWKNDTIDIPEFPSTFELLKKNIFKGGQGSISIYTDGKKKYAIKKINKDGIYQYFNLLYLKEMEICQSNFSCPLGLYKKGNYLFIVMEYLENYEHLNKTVTKLSYKKRVKVAQKILDLIRLLHKNGLSHNDLKSENILVNPKTLKVHIIDFGGAIVFSKDSTKQYELVAYTKSHITINPLVSHKKRTLFKNDMDTLEKILFLYVHNIKKTDLKSLTIHKKLLKILDYKKN